MAGVSQRGGSEAVAGGLGPAGGARRRRVLCHPVLLVMLGVMTLASAVASVIRYVNLGSGLDLSLFDQAVWHYSRFQAPFSSIHGEDLLGDAIPRLVERRKVLAYPYKGYWTSADTVKERAQLEEMYHRGSCPWMVWDPERSRC